MKYLLDTRVLIAGFENDTRRLGRIVDIFADSDSECYVSLVSYWEIILKGSIGKIKLYQSLCSEITDSGFTWLHITPEHIDGILDLPHYHRDPFDRLLIAQAEVSKMTLLTFDGQIKQYL